MSPLAPKVIAVDQIEAVPGPGSLTWHPVRHTLGIRAFGCNAYTAASVGDDLVEPHDELPGGDPEAGSEQPRLLHQELYFVAAGRARFTIDGVDHDAPAGTYVFVPDAASHRHAVAVEVPATVLSFGGPPTFTPSAWEWSFRATPLIRSDPDRARAILDEGLREHPESAGLRYNLACLEAISGNREAALAALRVALAASPALRRQAPQDEDLAGLRGDPEFEALR